MGNLGTRALLRSTSTEWQHIVQVARFFALWDLGGEHSSKVKLVRVRRLRVQKRVSGVVPVTLGT